MKSEDIDALIAHSTEWKKEFALLWGIAPPSSLKGKKGAEIISFIESTLNKLLERVAGEVSREAFEQPYQAGQFAMHADGYNQGIEEAVETIRSFINPKPSKEK